MRLFANGCSFTWGGHILEEERGLQVTWKIPHDHEHSRFRESVVWPARLHAMLGSDGMVNLGMGCGSNQRIVRTTIEYFTTRLSRGEDVTDYIAVIQWTEPSRYELFDPDTKSWLRVKSDVVLPEVPNDRYDDLQMRLTEDPINHMSDMFRDTVCLAGFFDRCGIRYIFTSMLPVRFADAYQNWYCQNHMTWFGGSPQHGICGTIGDKSYTYASGHPNLKGHQKIAADMRTYMENIGILI